MLTGESGIVTCYFSKNSKVGEGSSSSAANCNWLRSLLGNSVYLPPGGCGSAVLVNLKRKIIKPFTAARSNYPVVTLRITIIGYTLPGS